MPQHTPTAQQAELSASALAAKAAVLEKAAATAINFTTSFTGLLLDHIGRRVVVRCHSTKGYGYGAIFRKATFDAGDAAASLDRILTVDLLATFTRRRLASNLVDCHSLRRWDQSHPIGGMCVCIWRLAGSARLDHPKCQA